MRLRPNPLLCLDRGEEMHSYLFNFITLSFLAIHNKGVTACLCIYARINTALCIYPNNGVMKKTPELYSCDCVCVFAEPRLLRTQCVWMWSWQQNNGRRNMRERKNGTRASETPSHGWRMNLTAGEMVRWPICFYIYFLYYFTFVNLHFTFVISCLLCRDIQFKTTCEMLLFGIFES